MPDPEFGRLEQRPVRDHWPDEARDFTPWLAQEENIRLLGEALGLELEVESTEQAVGPFSADIVCRETGGGHRLVVENQLERTDHDHLGKLLTYAAGLEDVHDVVWIADRFTDEHRAALDWLNGVTDDSTRFFGVQIEVWQIAQSPPAPRFNLVSKPNEWAKTVRAVSDRSVLSDIKQDQLQCWTDCHEYLITEGSRIRPTKPVPATWINVAVGKAGVHLSTLVSDWDLQLQTSVEDINRVELVLEGETASAFFEQLQRKRSEIESRLDTQLVWYAPENTRSRKVFVQRPAKHISTHADWNEQFRWLREQLERFDDVFRPLLRELDADLIPASDPDAPSHA